MNTVALMDAILHEEILIFCMIGVLGMAMWRG